MESQQEVRNLFSRLKTFFIECKRVFTITKKPSAFEFKAIVKVSAIGIGLIGLIGFGIHLLWQMIK